MSTKIPSMSPTPDHYAEYATHFAKVQDSALVWNSTINARLLAVPKITTSNLTLLQGLFDKAIRDAKELQTEPTSDYLKEHLENKIAQAREGISDIIGDVKDLEQKLNTFHSEMPNQAKELSKVAELMLSDKGVDDAKVRQLQDDIKALTSRVDELTAEMLELGAGGLAAIGVGALALLAGPEFAVITFFAAVAVAVVATFIALDGKELDACNRKIKQDSKDIGELNTIIAILKTQSDNFTKLSEEVTALQDNLKMMIHSWQQIENGLNEAENEIWSASKDYTAEDWKSVETDFENAKKKTTDLIESIKPLDISTLKGTTAKLTPGMSADEVKAAVDASETMPIVEYIRQLA